MTRALVLPQRCDGATDARRIGRVEQATRYRLPVAEVGEYLVHEKLALTIGIASVHDVGRRRRELRMVASCVRVSPRGCNCHCGGISGSWSSRHVFHSGL